MCPELPKMSAQALIPLGEMSAQAGILLGGALWRKSAKVSLTISQGQSVSKLLREGRRDESVVKTT